MHTLRSIGLFLIACALLCGVMAYERYQTAHRTAEAIANALAGIEVVSFNIPLETKVAGFIGVMFLVAGLRCVWNSRRYVAATQDQGMI